ncbi:hypothetical protein BKA60DRAFT_467070, partial [Fusarium oxysporum]
LRQSFNRKVDCCCWRLNSMSIETLQWLSSIIAISLSGILFGHKGKKSLIIKYYSVGYRYLSFY